VQDCDTIGFDGAITSSKLRQVRDCIGQSLFQLLIKKRFLLFVASVQYWFSLSFYFIASGKTVNENNRTVQALVILQSNVML
jgi:hypothetical protein